MGRRAREHVLDEHVRPQARHLELLGIGLPAGIVAEPRRIAIVRPATEGAITAVIDELGV